MLKKLRVLFAVVMGAVITFYFLDFAGAYPDVLVWNGVFAGF